MPNKAVEATGYCRLTAGVGAEKMKTILASLMTLICAMGVGCSPACTCNAEAIRPPTQHQYELGPGEFILDYTLPMSANYWGAGFSVVQPPPRQPVDMVWELSPEKKASIDSMVEVAETNGLNGMGFRCKGEWVQQGHVLRVTEMQVLEDEFKEHEFVLEYRVTNGLYRSSPPTFVIRRTFTTYLPIQRIYWEIPKEQKTALDAVLQAADTSGTDKIRFLGHCKVFRDWRFSPVWVTTIQQTNIEFNVQDEEPKPQPTSAGDSQPARRGSRPPEK